VSVADRGRPLASCWEWHGDGTRPTRRLDLVSITNMDEAASSEEGLVALRAALLAYYDEHTSALGRQPLLTRRERLMSQALERLRLKWLAIGASWSWARCAPSAKAGRSLATYGPWPASMANSPARIPMWRGPRCCGW
jgi:hypothetical protein